MARLSGGTIGLEQPLPRTFHNRLADSRPLRGMLPAEEIKEMWTRFLVLLCVIAALLACKKGSDSESEDAEATTEEPQEETVAEETTADAGDSAEDEAKKDEDSAAPTTSANAEGTAKPTATATATASASAAPTATTSAAPTIAAPTATKTTSCERRCNIVLSRCKSGGTDAAECDARAKKCRDMCK